jgi:hypothetical protein
VTESLELTGADRADLLDLYGRYALAIDFGDGSGWAECFAHDGSFVANRGEGMEPVIVRGRDELDTFARNHRLSPSGKTRHHFTNIATSGTEQGATGRAAILYVEGRAVLGSGLYVDSLVRVDGGWLFNERAVNHERLRD